MPFALANGINQHYATMGPFEDPDAPLAVLIHGVLIDSLASYYFTLGTPFAEAGVATLMYDLRGHGKTEKPATGYAMTDYAADIIGLLDALNITKPVFLIGNSFGGSVGLFAAARYPERIAGVVMVDAEAPTYAWAARLRTVLAETSKHLVRGEVMAFIRVKGGRHLHKQAKAALATLTSTRIEQEVTTGSMLTSEELRDTLTPVLALYAGEWNIKAEAPHLKVWLPNCQTDIIDGYDHSVLVEHPYEITGRVLPWINAVRDGSAISGP